MFKCFLVSNRVRPMRYGIERFHNPTLTTINTCIIFGIVTILSLFNCQSIFAQEQPVEWGKIPRADLEMADFPDDTNAVAVILADVGKVTFKGDFNLIFERHRRIKILSEGGYEWGSFSIPFYAKKKYQSIDKKDIEGQTFILNTDGSQRHVKLDKASIFDEDIDGKYRRIRFTLPALTPGCVVEYRYRVKSKNPTFLHNWKFQTSEPTRWSEFCADIPSPFNYAMIWQGIKKFDLEKSTSYPWPHELEHFRTAKAFHLVINSHRWGMRDMPALREEPFMTTPEDYRAKIRFQLQSTFWPLQAPTLVMHSWQKLAEELMDSKYFGREIERHKVLRKQARSLVADLNNPEEKMLAIYDYVRTTMAWNGEYGIYKDVDLDDAFKARHGGGPEIALMLTGMLRFAGLDARPVLISTRKNGRIFKQYSMLSQFNHVLTYIKIDSSEYLLDATDPFRPYNLLPVAALNELGFLVDKENPVWIRIVSPGYFINRTVVSAILHADGSISGWFDSTDEGYSGLFDRRTLRDKNKKEVEYIRDGWLSDLTGAKLDSFTISNRDSIYAPLRTKAFFTSSDHTLVAGDKIFFNPVFFGRRDENPFKLQKRTFPVDFAYGRRLSYTMYLTLPEGCELLERPENISIDLPNNGGQFMHTIYINENQLQVLSDMVIRKPRFEPEEYQALRNFYDRVVAAHAEQVVLQRQSPKVAGKEKSR